MRAVKLQLFRLLALSDPREGAKVCEADLHRLALHLRKGIGPELAMSRANLVGGAVQHSHPIGDEMTLAGLGIVELAGESGSTAPAQAVAITRISPTSSWLTANSSAA